MIMMMMMMMMCRWGCMLRSGQMMLAQALVLHWLGRDWRLTSSSGLDLSPTERWQSERLYRAILSVFSDTPDTRAAPLSLHTMLRLGQVMMIMMMMMMIMIMMMISDVRVWW